MKIAFLCWEFPPRVFGGLGTYAQYMVQELAARGHDLTVWTADPERRLPACERRDAVEVRRIPGFDATPAFPHVVTDELRGWGGFFNDLLVYNAQTAAALIDDPDADIISVQDWLSAMAGLIAAQQQRPVVFHVHSAEWGRRPDGGSPAVRYWEAHLAHLAQAVVTVSEAMRDDLAAHGWDASKVTAIWNGVDPERYGPDRVPRRAVRALRRRYGLVANQAMVLFVGRLEWFKGVVPLVECLPSVVAQHPELRLVILGRGELETALEQRVHALGMEHHVRLRYEFVPEEERMLHFAACDLAVFPSLYEPFGIVSLEAMAMAKPVVAGARGVVGFREQVIAHGPEQTGLHVNGADPADIAWGLNEALSDRERLRQWGTRGRRRVLESFTWKAAAARTEALYQRVLAVQRGGAA